MSQSVQAIAVILTVFVGAIMFIPLFKFVIVIFLPALFLYSFFWDKSSKGQQQQLQYVIDQINNPKLTPSDKGIFFHGTDRDAALEIATTTYWLASDDEKGIWVGDTIDVARKFSGKEGAIIVVQILPPLKPVHPSHKPKGYFVIKIQNAKPEEEYYHIPNIRVINVLDYQGNTLL